MAIVIEYPSPIWTFSWNCPDEDVLALSEALDHLAAINPRAAELIKLRYYAGLTGREAAEVLSISPRKADQIWAYARAWLFDCLNGKLG